MQVFGCNQQRCLADFSVSSTDGLVKLSRQLHSHYLCSLRTQCCLHRWLSQARQEFTQGAQEHLMVSDVECDDLVQEGLQALDQEMQAWVEQLRQNKVWR